MKKELREKLIKVVNLVDKKLGNPNVDLDYCIPKVTMTDEDSMTREEPYIQLTCTLNEEYTHKQRVPIKRTDFNKTPEEIASLVILYIEEFTEQCASVEAHA